MQKFTYDRFNRIEVPTFVLSNVYHHQIGVLTNIDIDSIDINFNMNSQQEISLDVYKELNGEKCELWDEIVSLRYIFIPEHKEYYKIEVTTDDENKTTKHLVCSSASEYELSNKIIRSLEINTETDILRNNTGDDSIPAYAPNVLYNPTDPSNSILNRILADKAPDWSIEHVDSTIANIQRTFSISNQKIYDCLTQTIAKEYDCLFVFDSVNRTISAYDLLNYCRDCGKRGEFTTECPKCGSTNIQKGYGKDTHIFITYNNFSEKITVDGDEGAVKNCFAVQGGDDYMSSTVKNINPNGSEYIYNFSTADYKDMPQDLINKLESYQDEYNRILPAYQAVTEQWYNAVNDYWYYKTSMMPRANSTRWEADTHYDVNQWVYTKTLPSWCHLTCVESSSSSKTGSVEFDCTSVVDGQIIQDGDIKWRVDKYIISVGSAEQQLDKIVEYFETNKVYFKDNYPTSITVVSNEVKNIAGLAINSLFKIDVVDTPTRDGDTWIGTIKVYNTGNQDDKVTETISVPLKIVASLFEYTDYLTQQVDKRLHKADLTYDSVLDIEIPRDDDGNYVESQDTVFKEALTEYALDSLSNFEKSYNACIQTLANNGIKDESSEFMGWNMYDPMYLPYWTRLQWIQEEMAYREITVNHAKDLRDSYVDQMRQYNKDLDLQVWLGDRLFKIFWSYVREDTYQNSNYISTGLSDGEVINDAKQLLEIAQDELKKACELQITLNDDISNLLNTEEFKDYKDKFNIGDYIVCEADETIYRLRLISVSFSCSSPDSINLTFSNFTKITNFLSDAQSVISSAQSISGSYNAVMHQVIKNANTTAEVDNWKENGIASSSASVFSNEDQEVIIDQNGILARSYDDTKDLYSPKQFRITNNRLAFTDDDWKTTTMGIGELEYDWYNEEATTEHPVAGWNRNTPGYGVDAKFVTAGVINGSQIIGGQVYSNNYTKASGTTSGNGSHIDLTTGEFSLAGNELYAYIDPQTGKYVVSYKGDYEGHADVDVGSTLGVWTVAADGFSATNAYLKPNGIAVTGNVSAPDYIVGSGANAWTLSEKMASKQDVLTAGANITIQPVGDNLVISATGGGSGTEVIPNPVGTPTDTLNTVEIDGVIYDIVGGSSGLQYFVETQTSLYGQNTIDDELRRNGNYRFNHAVSARYNLHKPSSTWGDVQFDTINDNGEVVIAVTWERTIITSLWSQSTGEDNGIMVITTDPTVCGLNATDRTSIYQTLTASYVYGDFTDEQSHYDSIGGWATSTFTYEGTTYYVMLCHNNTYKDWSYEADSIKTIGSTLHYKDDRGIYSSVAEFALAVFTMSNTGQTTSGYSGLHRTGSLAFFAGASNPSGDDALIKIYSDGTSEGLVTEEEIQDYAKKEDVPEIEANPQDTPTDVLNSINIDGTAYEIQGGGGGALNYFHETQNSLYGEYVLTTPKWSCLDGYYFDYQVEDHVGINDPSEHTPVIKANNVPAIICGVITNSIGHISGSYMVGGIVFISKSPEGTNYTMERGGVTYSGGYSVGDTRLDGNTANMVDTYEYDGETWYVAVMGSLGLSGGGYPQDGNILHPSGIGGDYKNVHTVVGEIFNLVNPYEIDKYYSGLHQGDNLAFFAGGLDSNGTGANIKIFTDGTTEGLVTEEDLPQIEANPSETPTDVLNSINIDGTAYEIQGGGGGSSGSAYREVVLWNNPTSTASWSNPVTMTLNDDITNYHELKVVFSNQSGDSYGYVTIPVSEVLAHNYTQYFSNDAIGGASNYVLVNAINEITGYPKDTGTTTYYVKVIGIKYGGNLSPIIYSTEEREVGVWTDNKPLYQKTILFSATTSQRFSVNLGVQDVEHIFLVPDGCYGNGGTWTIPYVIGTDASNNVGGYFDNLGTGNTATFEFRVGQGSASYNQGGVITVRYTKTTDIAGSGEYNTLGIPNVHYDGNEKVIGTWFGEMLYQQCIDLSSITISAGSTVTVATIHGINLKKALGTLTETDDTTYAIPDGGLRVKQYGDDIKLTAMGGSSWVIAIGKLIIEYTKTS